MPNDNTLGAPTEGLGQTVTFAAGTGLSTPQQSPTQRSALRMDQQGGGAIRTAQALSIPPAQGPSTFGALMKLGGEILKPHIQEEQNRMFMEGMQKAAQGEAVTEIVNEQPWYSKLFGSTSLVDGARAYTASSKATSVSVDLEENMDSLRTLSPQEFAAHSAKKMQEALTGDPATDMMLTHQISTTLPTVMKGQAKAHFRYQQELFTQGIANAADAKFALLGTMSAKARTPGATTEDTDVLGAAIDTLDVFEKPAEMQQAVHDKIIANAAIKSITGGNFAAYSLLKDSGKLAKLDPQDAHYVQRAYEQASNQAKMNVPKEFLVGLADFRTLTDKRDSNGQPIATDAEVQAAADQLDKKYTQLTGDPSSFVGKAATLQELTQLRNHQDAYQAHLRKLTEQANTKEAKDAAHIMEVSAMATRVVAGDGRQPYLMVSQTPKEQQEVFDHLRATASPDVRLKVLVEQVGVAIDKVEKDTTEAAIATAKRLNDPMMLYKVYSEKYLPIVKAGGDIGISIAGQYAGAYARDMALYHSLARGRQLDAADMGVYASEVAHPTPKPLPASKRNKETIQALTTGTVMSLFTTGLKDPEGYASIIEPYMKDYLPVKEAVNDAKLQLPTLSTVGGYHWRRSESATDLTKWLASNRQDGGHAYDNLDKAMEVTASKFATEAGIDGAFKVGQTADSASKEPQLYVLGTGSDGNVKTRIFKASDIQTTWQSGVGRIDAGDFVFGKGILPAQAPDDMPSIYASQDVWRAYREKQAKAKLNRK